MEYLLEDIVRLSGLSVDTIRYYQTLRLIPPPAHKGRKAVYDDGHLDRLRLVRRASEQGFPLLVTRDLLSKHELLESNRELLTAVQKQLAALLYERGHGQAARSSGAATPFGGEPGARRHSRREKRPAALFRR